MEITLQKESVTRWENDARHRGEVLTESDVIVPDAKPDMGRILKTEGRARVTASTKQGDRVSVSGVCDYCVLYVPENAEEGYVESLDVQLPFKDVFTGFSENEGEIDAEAEVMGESAVLLNSRKLSVKGTVSLLLHVGKKEEKEVTVGIAADKVPAIRTRAMQTVNAAAHKKFTITAGQRMEIPEENPPMDCILRTDARVYEEDVKVITGKMIIKGTVRLETLYRASDGMPYVMEHGIPYTEILDIPAAEEGMSFVTDYAVTDIYCEKDDEDETARSFGAEVTMEIRTALWQDAAIEYLEDAYIPGESTVTRKEPVNLETAIHMIEEGLALRQTVALGEDMPPIARVVQLYAVPSVTGVTVEGGTAEAKGNVQVGILYLTDGGAPYLATDKIAFSLSVPTKAAEDAAIALMVRLENASYTLSGADSVDVRLNLDIRLRLTESKTIENIASIEETEGDPGRASLVIAFANGKDSLWEIGKRYSAAAEKIGEVNGLCADAIPTEGTRLLIP